MYTFNEYRFNQLKSYYDVTHDCCSGNYDTYKYCSARYAKLFLFWTRARHSKNNNKWSLVDIVVFISYKSDACCSKLVLDGSDALKQSYGDIFGTYDKTTIHGSNQVFKHKEKDYYLHRSFSSKWKVGFFTYFWIDEWNATS